VVKEGMGMQETMERCGLGWFLPKINWATRRLAPPHGENILVGNVLMHAEYKRRWQAVKDLRDVFVRFNQAEGWYHQHDVQTHPRRLEKWLEYLHVLNIEQFDLDVWKAMQAAHKRTQELSPIALTCNSNVSYCYKGMKDLFLVNGVVSPPHLVTGNKMRFETVGHLLNFLFLWEDREERRGWSSKPYRVILQKSFELVKRRLGDLSAREWLDKFFHLVRLTHWILPYPSNTSLISASKTSRSQGLTRRMMWFSAVYAHPDKVELPFETMPQTLYTLLWRARRQIGSSDDPKRPWQTTELIEAARLKGIQLNGQDKGNEYWIVGRRSVGAKGFLPVWERSQAPMLEMQQQIQNKSLDELEELMVSLTQTQGEADGADGAGEVDGLAGDIDARGAHRRGAGSRAPTRLSVGDFFTQQLVAPRDRNSGPNKSCGGTTASAGSVFLSSTRGSQSS